MLAASLWQHPPSLMKQRIGSAVHMQQAKVFTKWLSVGCYTRSLISLCCKHTAKINANLAASMFLSEPEALSDYSITSSRVSVLQHM
jgi:hypothetical protein